MIGPRPAPGAEARDVEGSPTEPAFAAVLSDLLSRGVRVRFRVTGASMAPTIRDGDEVTVEPIAPARLRRGDVVLAWRRGALVAHRLMRRPQRSGGVVEFLLRGDAADGADAPVPASELLGRVVEARRGTRTIAVSSWRARISAGLHRVVRRLRARLAR